MKWSVLVLAILLGTCTAALAAPSFELLGGFGDPAKEALAQESAIGRAAIHLRISSSSFEVDATLGAASTYDEAEFRAPATLSLVGASNPVSAAAAVTFNLPQRAHVSVRVFDVLGRAIATLAEGEFLPGLHVVQWNGASRLGHSALNGVYWVQLSASGRTATQRIALIR